jgi:ABC-type uncharacterized transport system substrate-binding protein
MQFDAKRREFLKLVTGAVAWPLTAHAQQPATMPAVGFLHPASPRLFGHLASAFREGLGDLGYHEGKNVAIEYRWADGDYGRLPALAADLVSRSVVALACTGDDATFRAARAATTTTTIPLVFLAGGDSGALGSPATFNRRRATLPQ